MPRSSRSVLGRLVLAASGGALYALSMPPVGWWWAGWLAMTPLCLACLGVRPAMGALLGLAFGGTIAVGTSPWFPAMIGDYFGQPGPFGWLLAVMGWTLCGAMYHALLGGWLAWAQRSGCVSPFAVGAAWWLIDWARANAPIANPWALLGYSQMGFLPLAQLADLAGPYGVGALLASVGASVAGVLAPHDPGRSRAGNAIVAIVLLACSLSYGMIRLSEGLPGNDPIRAALVQGALPDRLRSDPNDADAHLDHHLRLTEQIVRKERVDLVLWPELALDFYIEDEPLRRRRLVEAVKQMGVELIAGGLGMDPEARRPTNAAFLITDRGLRARYDKKHLMVFSEANPLPFDAFAEDAMSAGRGLRLLHTKQAAVGLAICSEAMHPGYVRQVVRTGAEVLLAPSFDRWFGSVGGRRQQLDAVRMRAIETRRFLLRPTASGITAVVDPYGRVLAAAPIDEAAALPVSFSISRKETVYLRFGDLGLAAALAWLVFDAVGRLRRRRRRTGA